MGMDLDRWLDSMCSGETSIRARHFIKSHDGQAPVSVSKLQSRDKRMLKPRDTYEKIYPCIVSGY